MVNLTLVKYHYLNNYSVNYEKQFIHELKFRRNNINK